jgi:hypothetical protein
MERVARKIALPAKAVTFAGQKKIEDMPGDLEGDRAGVTVEPNKSSNP